jgi:DNA-binding NtrC family response regulator
MRVFIADDEHQYRSHISKALKRRGHTVETADTGRVAIERGILFRPDVLVSDWMFRDQLHGVHVATALQSVFPRMKTVLISGFASDDLALDARRAGIDCFLEKPFDIAQVTQAVEDVVPGGDELRATGFALLELDKEGRIVYVNEHTEKLLETQGGTGDIPRDIDGLLGSGGATVLDKARTVWTKISPPSATAFRWILRARQINETTILVIIPEENRDLQAHPVLKNLLEIQTSSSLSWPRTDRVIVIDDSSAVRHMYHQSLERVGCVSYKAGSHDIAVKLLREDTRVSVVIVDYDMPGIDTKILIDEMRSIRPDLKIVGNSGEDHREDFEKMGVYHYLGKPWSIPDLIVLLQG